MIDVVIPYHPKDEYTLKGCIDNVRKHFKECGNVYVLSKDKPPCDDVGWLPESEFSFAKEDIVDALKKHNIRIFEHRHGWLYQQFLKLCVFSAFDNISDTILILDSDVIFRKEFTAYQDGKLAYGYTNRKWWSSYITNMRLIHPELEMQTVVPFKSGVCHMMLFEKKRVEELLWLITRGGQESLHEACLKRLEEGLSDASFSEYETYFNYILCKYPNEYAVRFVDWVDVDDWLNVTEDVEGFIYIANHAYRREWVKALQTQSN